MPAASWISGLSESYQHTCIFSHGVGAVHIQQTSVVPLSHWHTLPQADGIILTHRTAAPTAGAAEAAVVLTHADAVQATDSAVLKRRSRATEAMGLMGTANGKEAIAPMVPDIMQAALKVLLLHHHHSRLCYILCCIA